MDVRVVASATGGEVRRQYLISYVIDGAVAIDAGSLGFSGSPRSQTAIKDVFLSHSHIDHVASLPIFVDNVYDGSGDCVRIHAGAETIDALRRDVFNGRVWPDMLRLSRQSPALLKLETLNPRTTVDVAGLRITPIPVNHTVPTFGFIVEDGRSAVAFGSDSAETEELWERANWTRNLKAVFLEATFPDSHAELAEISKHLTPTSFAREVRKLNPPVPVIAVHLKAQFYDEIVRELQALPLANVEIGEPGRNYSY